jgi:hypothetical protein
LADSQKRKCSKKGNAFFLAGRLSMMKAIKRAVSPKPQRSHPGNGNDSTPVTNVQETPPTSYICSRLRGENLKLFALARKKALLFFERFLFEPQAKKKTCSLKPSRMIVTPR